MFDQMLAGIAESVQGMPDPHSATVDKVVTALLGRADQPLNTLAKTIGRLDDDSRLNDGRSIRNRATHQFYEKYNDQHGWYVEGPRFLREGAAAWDGERHLRPYTAAMIELAEDIKAVADSAAACLADTPID
jgi:hypothetical protein